MSTYESRFIPIVGGDFKVAFVHPSEEKPGRVVQLADFLFIPDIHIDLFSFRAMEAKRFFVSLEEP